MATAHTILPQGQGRWQVITPAGKVYITNVSHASAVVCRDTLNAPKVPPYDPRIDHPERYTDGPI
jgi:hypothetical protein